MNAASPTALCTQLSALLAERSMQKLRVKNECVVTSVRNAENGPFLHSLLPCELTSQQSEDCYTFEGFAPNPDVIPTTYYYYYKRNILVLKEENTWS